MSDQSSPSHQLAHGVFVLTYNRPEQLRATLEAIAGQSRPPQRLLVVDNGDDPRTRFVAEQVGAEYHSPGENLGSAGGVAEGFEVLGDNGLDWITSVDDDDPPKTSDTFERLMELAARAHPQGAGILGTNGSYFSWRTGEHVRIPDGDLVGDVDIDIVGGNAFLTVSTQVLTDLGPPNREFFFGHYDPLYCLGVKKAGYRVVVSGELMHEYRRLAGRLEFEAQRRSLRPTDPYHALWRRYYVTRNYIHAMRGDLDRPDLARRQAAKALFHSVTSWARGPRYGWRFTRMQTRGIVDGYRSRLGRTVAPVRKPTAR